MNLSELLELSRAGFTKEDIFRLLGTNDNQQSPAPAADPVPDNQDSDPDPVPDPQQGQYPPMGYKIPTIFSIVFVQFAQIFFFCLMHKYT